MAFNGTVDNKSKPMASSSSSQKRDTESGNLNTGDNKFQTFSQSSTSQKRDLDTPQLAPELFTYDPMGASDNRTIKGLFTNNSVSDLLFVEIFAGTAKLSKAAKEVGMEVLPVDKTASRATQIHIAQYDVTDPDQLRALFEVLEVEKTRIAAVHLAPACGTASKAREKKLLTWAKKGFKNPLSTEVQSETDGCGWFTRC